VNTPAYRVEDGDAVRDRDSVLAIWSGNLGDDAHMQAKFDWFYRASPYGEPLLRLLRHVADGKAVGVASAGPRPMRVEGRALRAGVLVDLAVVAEHRALGPALTLQASFVQDGAARFDLLYGFPNPKAVPVFKRAGYDRLGDIVRHARVLRHAGYAARRLPRPLAWLAGGVMDLLRWFADARHAIGAPALVATWVETADPRFDTLWSDTAAPHALVGVRDAAFARWRFDASPLARTRYLLLADAADGRLRAWFACQTRSSVLHVCDFWADDAPTGIGHAYVNALVRAARKARHAAVSVEYAGADAKLAGWRAAGFVERSRRPVFGRWLDGTAGGTHELHLTAADEDE